MAAHYVKASDGEDQQPKKKGPPIPEADQAIACVPFVPWRCPSCGARNPSTYGQQGRIRYHRCIECNLRYRSIEIDASVLADKGIV